MSFASQSKRIEAARKRNERESVKRQKELERQTKERVKLSALEQAKSDIAAALGVGNSCS